MHFFLDESGNFTGIGWTSNPSLVGALIVPETKLSDIERRYLKLRPRLITGNDEVKGKELHEREVAAVVDILRRNEVLFEVSAIFLGDHTEDEVRNHQEQQARSVMSRLGPNHHPTVIEHMQKLQAQLRAMPLQLYVQSVVTFELVARCIEHGTIYYAQRRPRELGAFNWTIDAKDRRVTPWETWWSFVVMPMLQTKALRRPMVSLKEGDYSFAVNFLQDMPDYLLEELPPDQRGEKPGWDLRKIMQNMCFSPKNDPGLELVDIVTNSVRRALSGTMKQEGWQGIPALMINRDRQPIQFISMMPESAPRRNLDLIVPKAFLHGRRSMIAPRFSTAPA